MFADSDEGRHQGASVESWWWWAQNPDASIGAYVGFELRGDRFDYWAGLLRAGMPYLYVEELDGVGLRGGLEIKPPEMWADHQCDVPFVQWSIGNEAHGVLLDDPTEAWRRAYGTPVPITFDLEWHASAVPSAMGDQSYEQVGEVDARIETVEGLVEFVGRSHRIHQWGTAYHPSTFAMPVATSGLRAPYRRSDGVHVDQVLARDGWFSRTVAER